MTRPDGTPVNAVYGFTTMLMKLIDEIGADYLAVIFDAAKHTFRNEIYPDYKAHRPEPPDELKPQFELIREATRAFDVACIESPGWEADDLIATYARVARETGFEVTIVSSDKDLMQLIRPGVTMFDAMKNRSIGPEEVREKFGVEPERVVDVQALAGDSTDNVPGVPGIGVKTAAQLIHQFGELETLLARAGEIPQPKRRQALIDHAEAARLSKRLVRLSDDVPLPQPLEALAVKPRDDSALLAFVEAQSFKSLVARVSNRAAARVGGATAATETVEASRYQLVGTAAELDRWIAAARAAGVVAVDTETTSLDAIRAELVGVSLALLPGEACYVPLAHRILDGSQLVEGQIPRDAALAGLKALLEDPSVLKIGQNIKYDMEVLARYGIAVAPIDDTTLLSYVIEGGLHAHGMDELAKLLLGIETIPYSAVAGTGKAQVTFDRVPLAEALRYAAEDADVTLRLHRALKPRLLEQRLVSVYETLERPLVGVLAAMERCGILVEQARLRALSREFESRLGELEAAIWQLAGHSFNIGSPKQLGEVLFDRLGLAGGKKGKKTGAYATGADVLETLAAEGHELPARMLDWRQLAKLKSTYTDALLAQINPETGRVHTSYQQAVANTGRLSSSDPNLQNIPVRTEEGRKIRQAFVAAPGHGLLSADYSQVELRLLAHIADIVALKQAFSEGQDIHTITAAQVFGAAADDPQARRKAKAINFGIIYGISPFGLARQLGIDRRDAAAYIEAYFQRYPGIRGYMERTRRVAREQGFVTTLFGRRCHVRGIADRNPSVRNFAERAAINAPIQGSAADIIKRAMVRLPAALAAARLSAKMLLQVHDELVFELPEEQLDDTRALVVDVMQRVACLDVPLVVDVGFGRNWDEAH
jgi:DNA polymerase-1